MNSVEISISNSVVVAGCVNVGKSSIVKQLSSCDPEVHNYPFTTRRMTMGHMDLSNLGYGLVQVMDTPGLLRRGDGDEDETEGDGKRNEMEKLTLSCLKNVPCCVLFVYDFTEDNIEGGSSHESQIVIREMVRSLYPKRPWVDVVTKSDMDYSSDMVEALKQSCSSTNDFEPIVVSGKEGDGMDSLEERIKMEVGRLDKVIKVIKGSEGGG